MAATVLSTVQSAPSGYRVSAGRVPARLGLIGLGVILTALFLLVPVTVIFVQAFSKGWDVYAANIIHPDTLFAIGLTVLTSVVVVPLNLGFGLAAAWAIAKFRFPGRKVLTTLIDLPFSISPIVAGVCYLLLYGSQGLLGPWLEAHHLRLMFAVPGIILVTLFVTSPFIARELIPLMQVQGVDDEEAAMSLGASGWRSFITITLPNVKWALLYGVILCNARAMGEFGAVSVVSGHIRRETNTLPLQIDVFYNDYNAVGAFAAATVLAGLAVVTLIIKSWVEGRRAKA
jgi:sulfate transport system permease protein